MVPLTHGSNGRMNTSFGSRPPPLEFANQRMARSTDQQEDFKVSQRDRSPSMPSPSGITDDSDDDGEDRKSRDPDRDHANKDVEPRSTTKPPLLERQIEERKKRVGAATAHQAKAEQKNGTIKKRILSSSKVHNSRSTLWYI